MAARPVLDLRAADDGDLIAAYLDVFEHIWTDALPLELAWAWQLQVERGT